MTKTNLTTRRTVVVPPPADEDRLSASEKLAYGLGAFVAWVVGLTIMVGILYCCWIVLKGVANAIL